MEIENGCSVESGQCEAPQPGRLMAYGEAPTIEPRVTHGVNVEKVANGFVLRIGCSTFVAKNWEEASTGIADYWKDPVAARKKYTI